MEKEGVEYTLQERWQINVFKNLDFNDEEFLCLSSEMQSLIYRTANNFNNTLLVARLNTLGKYTTNAPITRPSILSLRMDIATAYQILSDYLVKLRQEDRLLTENEFQDFQSNQSWRKKSDFTRILGRDYILHLVEELHLKHIKVPVKKAVINPSNETISFKISQHGKGDLVRMDSEDITIYAQDIQKVDRLLSREEMTELFTIIEAAKFTDLKDVNFIIAEDGIYFIDTEIRSFYDTNEWAGMKNLSCFMPEKDQEWFIDQIRLKSEDQNRTEQEGFLGFKFAHRYGKGAKKRAQEQLAKGITDTATISFAVKCQQIVKQYKLVGSNRFCNPETLMMVGHHSGRPFSFPVQDLLK